PPPDAQPTRTETPRLNEAATPSRLRLPNVSSEEPDFLANFAAIRATEERAAIDLSTFEPPISQEDTKPTSAIKAIAETDIFPRAATETIESLRAEPSSAIMDTVVRSSARATEERPAVVLPTSPDSESFQRTTEQPRVPLDFQLIQPPEPLDRDATPIFQKTQPKTPEAPPVVSEATPPPPIEAKSIWEIFGVPRPAENAPEPVNAIQDEPAPDGLPTRTDSAPPSMGDTTTYMILTGRMGLRARRRRDMARLRRPPA
ncbi:MAG: hypothetical protein SGI73_00690, partial [Chloroflexota bacterium]|nr:hypothetical protein [Chloroflexota bacterium]